MLKLNLGKIGKFLGAGRRNGNAGKVVVTDRAQKSPQNPDNGVSRVTISDAAKNLKGSTSAQELDQPKKIEKTPLSEGKRGVSETTPSQHTVEDGLGGKHTLTENANGVLFDPNQTLYGQFRWNEQGQLVPSEPAQAKAQNTSHKEIDQPRPAELKREQSKEIPDPKDRPIGQQTMYGQYRWVDGKLVANS